MAENEPSYPLRLPLVDGEGKDRKVIGTAEIDGKGEVIMTVTDEEYQRALQPPPFSLSLPGEPEKTLQEFIHDGLMEAADAAHEAVMREVEKDTAGGMDHFIGISGIFQVSVDDEDHIIRGVD